MPEVQREEGINANEEAPNISPLALVPRRGFGTDLQELFNRLKKNPFGVMLDRWGTEIPHEIQSNWIDGAGKIAESITFRECMIRTRKVSYIGL